MRMRKIYWGILFAIIIGLGVTDKGYCGWPVNKTLPIQGKITDASTGKPIENVIVSCVWWKQYLIGGPGGPQRKRIASKYTLTDKEGQYRIPGEKSFHVLSTFNTLDIYVNHPLYESKTMWGFYIKPMGSKEWIYRDEHNKILDLKPKDGIIYYDIPLLSLEEKYVINPSTETARKFDDYLRISYGKDENYFVLAKKFKILNNDFLDLIFTRLFLIVNKLPDCEDKFRAKERIEFYKKEYMQ